MSDFNATNLDQVFIECFLNEGPSMDKLNEKNLYKNAFGSPIAMEMHSSLDGMYRFGWVLFSDRFGMRETLPLTGNEIITVRYLNNIGLSGTVNQAKTIHFNIFDIEEIQADPTSKENRFTDKAIKLHLIEAPFFLKYNTDIWTTSYGKDVGDEVQGVAIDEIINDHLTDKLQINTNLFNIKLDKMQTKMHFCCPSWKTQMMFTYLLQYAKDDLGHGNVNFYTTSDTKTGHVNINLRSMNKMFLQNANVVEFTAVDTQPFTKIDLLQNEFAGRNLNQIISFKFLTYDLSTLASGFSGGHTINFDYNNSKVYTLNDNYTESNTRADSKYFYSFAPWSDSISTTKSKLFQLGYTPKELSKTYLNNQITDHQYQIRCELITYVNENVEIGDKIVIVFPSGLTAVGDASHSIDEQMTGSWIVEEIVDSVMNGRGARKMIVCKDSFLNVYAADKRAKTNQPHVEAVGGTLNRNG